MRRLRSALRRIPVAAWWCAAVAFANVTVWTLVTPPFHVPDETAHVAYVQHLSAHAEPPNEPGGPVYASTESALIDALGFIPTFGRPENHAIWYGELDEQVDATEERGLPADDGGGTQSNSNQPPLYFALESVVYHASPWDSLLERLALMRLFSALLAGLTTMFVYMFLREVLIERWTWTVGALAVAFQPTFGFISGGVHNDALLFTASAALFFALARAFRRGLTLERGLGIGGALAVGALAKLNFIALVPGALAGLALLGWRARALAPALRGVGAATGVLAAAALAYIGTNLLLWDRRGWGGGIETAAVNATGGPAGVPAIGLTEQLSYTWQLYAPRLPFMNDQFVNFPPYSTWFKGFIGFFGWLDTSWPEWVYRLALGVAILLALLAGLALWHRRAAVAKRWPELVTYALMIAGLLGSIGFLGIRYREDTGFAFEQARYLLPLLPLYAAGVALAALGAGRRLARPLGAAIVVLALGHGVFAQLLVIARFYA